MARKSTKAQPQHVEPEDESQEPPEPKAATRKVASKAEAVRQALSAGFEGPQEGTAYIRQEFGIEMAPQHFSAVKSQLKKKLDSGTPAVRKGRGRPKGSKSQAVQGYLAPPPKPPADGGADLIDTLEALKPLIAQYGADKVKRIVDLLG